MEVYFIVAQPIGKTKKFKLTDDEYVVIGRSKEKCQVPLSDEMCSGAHCKVSLSNNCIFVEDMNSKNGIFLNGVRVLKQRIYIDDKVKIGDSIMYINHEKLSDEDLAYLTYKGNHTRIQSGYTLELDSHEKSGKSYIATHKQVIKDEYQKKRQKAYSNFRTSSKNKAPKISKEKLQVLEMMALGIDALISLAIFYFGIMSYKYTNGEEYYKLSQSMSSYQIIFSDEMAMHSLMSLVVAFLVFSVNRSFKNGSLGEKILNIN